MKRTLTLLFSFILLVAACSPIMENNTAGTQPARVLTATYTPSHAGLAYTASPTTAVATPRPTFSPENWREMPVIPEGVSPRMVAVYQRGLARGRQPNHFSKLGDCQSVPSLFLGIFDTGAYELGDTYAYLQPTIDYFAGSWSRESVAVKGGLNVAAVQTLYYTDPEHCELTESPMVCELRVYNPSLVLISFETWWADKPVSSYEDRLRAVVEYVLSQDVVPILATKADNLEGDYAINQVIAKLAYEYELPLWNFWAATDVLPSHGLSEDGFHLTFAQNYFDDPVRMRMAWPWRNLTALQAIHAVHDALDPLP